jgi:hypothetical protein
MIESVQPNREMLAEMSLPKSLAAKRVAVRHNFRQGWFHHIVNSRIDWA